MAPGARQQEALGLCQSRGWRQGAQNKNASHDLSKVVIGRYQAFCVQLAERDMQCPLVRPDLSKTVQREIDALTDTDSRGASEQERIGRQVIGPAEFVAGKLIVLWRGRSGQVLGPWREVLATAEGRLDGIAVGGSHIPQTAHQRPITLP